jgi:hypothetical protein
MQAYTRSIVQPSSVRILAPAPRRIREIVRDKPPASRHFSPVLTANLSHGGCDLLFWNARVLRCWPSSRGLALSSAPILDERHSTVVGKSDSAFAFPTEQSSIDAKPQKSLSLGELDTDLGSFPPSHAAIADECVVKHKFKCLRNSDGTFHFEAGTPVRQVEDHTIDDRLVTFEDDLRSLENAVAHLALLRRLFHRSVFRH